MGDKGELEHSTGMVKCGPVLLPLLVATVIASLLSQITRGRASSQIRASPLDVSVYGKVVACEMAIKMETTREFKGSWSKAFKRFGLRAKLSWHS